MFTKAFLSPATLFLATSMAGAAPQIDLSRDNRFVTIEPGKDLRNPPNDVKTPRYYLDGTLATKYPKGLYFCCYGATISGPSSVVGKAYAAATQFVTEGGGPTYVDKLVAAVGYVSGTHKVTLTIYSDSGHNTPGAVLASKMGTTTTEFGSCCELVTVRIPEQDFVPGTPYWIGVSASGSDLDTALESTTDQVDESNSATSTDGGATWTVSSSSLRIAVTGKGGVLNCCTIHQQKLVH